MNNLKDIKNICISKGLAIVSFMMLLISAANCNYLYYYNIAEEQFVEFPFIPWPIMCMNAFLSIVELMQGDDDYFCCFHRLIDYAQLVLTLPCITADYWLNYNVSHFGIAYLHAALGLWALLFYMVQEYRREDLTDLAIIFNYISLTAIGLIFTNAYAVVSAQIFTIAYFAFKRNEVICMPPDCQDKYNYAVTAFNALSILGLHQSMDKPLI